LILVGKSLGDNWDQIRPIFQKFDYVVVAIVVLAVAWYVYHHVSGAFRAPRRPPAPLLLT
jgi:hypothetical protein